MRHGGRLGILTRIAFPVVFLFLLGSWAPPSTAHPPPPILTLSAPFVHYGAHRVLTTYSARVGCITGSSAGALIPVNFSIRSGFGGGLLHASLAGCGKMAVSEADAAVGIQQLQFSVPSTGVYNLTIHWRFSFTMNVSAVPNRTSTNGSAWAEVATRAQWKDLNTTGLNATGRGNLRMDDPVFGVYTSNGTGNSNSTLLNQTRMVTFQQAHFTGGHLIQVGAWFMFAVQCIDRANHDVLTANVDLAQSHGFGVWLDSVTVTPNP
jgi:hypothetical protein